jgi:hypothetical protein
MGKLSSAMRIQMATKEQVEAMRIQIATKEQVDDLITTVDTLAYDTKACYCNAKRTNKGTAFLSLKDKDGVLVNVNQTSQLCGIGKPPLHPSPLPTSDQALIT